MHIVRMRYGGVPPITDPIEFRFDEQVNLLIGPNASGKSTTLLMIKDCFDRQGEGGKFPISQGESRLSAMSLSDDEFDESESFADNVVSVSADWMGSTDGLYQTADDPPIIFIGSTRQGLPGISELAKQELGDHSLDDVLSQPFSGLAWHEAWETLGRALWPAVPSDDQIAARGNVMRADRRALACCLDICAEVIESTRTKNYIPGPDHRGYLLHPFADPGAIRILRGLGMDTNDKRNFENLSIREAPSFSAYPEDHQEQVPIYVGHLSSGTEGTLLWIRWLALKMLVHYDYVNDWHEQPAILLIDEIENHLHPTWQRRVIPALRKHFPSLQIFATTHSPFVVAGLKAGQVHLLKRDEKGVITSTTNTEDIVGWTADEISRTMMGVDDPTDDATASAARKLRELRDEGPRATADAEAERQTDMQKQRQLVDRDLLAGGPKARRREDFAERFREALERRRQTEEFNQENG